MNLISVLASGLFGALLVFILTWMSEKHRRNLAKRAVLTAYAVELVEMFCRMVMIEIGFKKDNKFSFSELYETNDSQMLASLSQNIDNSSIVYNVIKLKERYFQIQRHLRNSSNLAYKAYAQGKIDNIMRSATSAPGKDCKIDNSEYHPDSLWVEATIACGTSIEFFDYQEMYRMTDEYLLYVENIIDSPFIRKLRNKLEERKLMRHRELGEKN